MLRCNFLPDQVFGKAFLKLGLAVAAWVQLAAGVAAALWERGFVQQFG